MARCPGQDMRYWQPEDIYTLPCPFCGEEIEFWKDEPFRPCRGCGKIIRNIRIDLGCAKWCKHAAECLGAVPETSEVTALFDRLMMALEKRHTVEVEPLRQACRVHACAMQLLPNQKDCDAMTVQATSLLCGELIAQTGWPPLPKAQIAPQKPAYIALLQEAGIDANLAEKIWILAESLLCGQVQSNPEYSLVHESIQRVMNASAPEDPSEESAGKH